MESIAERCESIDREYAQISFALCNSERIAREMTRRADAADTDRDWWRRKCEESEAKQLESEECAKFWRWCSLIIFLAAIAIQVVKR